MGVLIIDIFFSDPFEAERDRHAGTSFASSTGDAITHYKFKGATYLYVVHPLKKINEKCPQLLNAFAMADKSYNAVGDKLKVRINSHGDAKSGTLAMGKTQKRPEQVVDFLIAHGLNNSMTRRTVFTLFACETAFQISATSPCIAQRFRDRLTTKGVGNCVVQGSPFLLSGDAVPTIAPIRPTLAATAVPSNWGTVVAAMRGGVPYPGKMAF